MNAGTRRTTCVLALLPVLAACRAAPAEPAPRGPGVAQPAARAAPSRPIPPEQVALFLPPVELEAGGAPIDVTKLRGYAGPAVRDHDGDGRLDLFVGSFAGEILYFRNVGSVTAPAFAPGELLRAGGEELRISNW